jgi:hypothetical protein
MGRLTDSVESNDKAQSTLIKTHSDAIKQQTASILSIVSATPDAIADLKATTIMHAKNQSEHAQTLGHGLTSVTSHIDALSQISKDASSTVILHTVSIRRSITRLTSIIGDI